MVTTTHLKGSYLRRNGAAFSDKATLMEYITRHGDFLLVTTITTDPVWLEEPFVQTTNYQLDPHTTLGFYPCTVSEENISTAVPHFLPGQNPNLGADDIPKQPARGGAASTRPEYRLKLRQGLADTMEPARANLVPAKIVQPQIQKRDGDIHVMPVQGNIYMLVGPWGNIAASVGPDGILLVDTGPANQTEKIRSTVMDLAKQVNSTPHPNKCVGLHCEITPGGGWTSPAINAVISSPAPPKAMRYIINTSADPDHTGGNEKLGELPADSAIIEALSTPVGITPSATILAHQNVLDRLSNPGHGLPSAPGGALPTDPFHGLTYKLSEFFNNEGVEIYHEPNAHTDGDSIVTFRYSDVIAAGDILNTESYPVIDLEKGGTINGVLDGLNHILALSIPEARSQGGTWVIPGHGRLCDIGDVTNYRNMVAIMRDRIQDLMKKGMTLEQVKAARPTQDYDGVYGATSGPWTTEKFIEAAYKSLQPQKK